MRTQLSWLTGDAIFRLKLAADAQLIAAALQVAVSNGIAILVVLLLTGWRVSPPDQDDVTRDTTQSPREPGRGVRHFR